MPSTVTDRLQGLTTSVAVKAPVVCASTAALVLSSTQVVDGIALSSSQRVLVKDQAGSTDNGIYIVRPTAWERSKDFDGNLDGVPGTMVYVDRGTANSDTFWVFNSSSTAAKIDIGTTQITLSQITPTLTGDVSAASVTASGSTEARPLKDRFAEVINVKNRGAKGDGLTNTDGTITTGTPDFTSATAAFIAADAGKTILVIGAGAAGANLQTTILTFVSGTAVTLAANAGTTVLSANYVYGTDDSVALQAAIDQAESDDVGIVFFPAGSYAHGTTLTVNKAVKLAGAGRGGEHDQAAATPDYISRLLWMGGAADQLNYFPADSATGRRISSAGIVDIAFFGAGTATRGVLIKSVQGSEFRIYTESHATVGTEFDVLIDGSTIGEAADCQGNDVDIFFKQTETGDGIGVSLGGDANANFSANPSVVIRGLYKDSIAVEITNADNNVFPSIWVFRFGGGTGIGVVLEAGATATETCRANLFLQVFPGDGNLTAEGTPSDTVATSKNIIFAWDNDNMGTTQPVVEAGAELIWQDWDGRINWTDIYQEYLSARVLRWLNSDDEEVLRLSATSGATGSLDISAATAAVSLIGIGTATNVGLSFATKGTGQYTFYTNNFGAVLATLNGTRLDLSVRVQLESILVASLPAAAAGDTAYASDGRKAGETAGNGTGVLVFHDGTNWIACDTGATVAA